MPWIPAMGKQLDYPFALHAKIARCTSPQRDDVLDVLERAKAIHDEAMRMSARICELEVENMRLKHENEIMRKVLNEREA